MNEIEEQLLIETAVKLGGSQDFFGDEYLVPLRKLLASLNTEANLSRPGRRRVFMLLIDVLLKRASLADLINLHPEIKEIPIKKPIFIIGLPRTGTTLLHNLMSQDSANRTFKLWELSQPIKLTDFENDFEAELSAKTELWVKTFARLQPKFATIHPLQAKACDECNWLLQNTFAANIFSLHYYTPRYFQWLMGQDLSAQYQFYKLQLQAFLRRSKELQTNSLVLKSPDHLWHLEALLKIFPDANIIQLHRNISECVPSFCSLCHTLQEINCDGQTPEKIGEFCLEQLQAGVSRMLESRARNKTNKFIDVSYQNLVKNPLETVKQIYQNLGREVSSEAIAAMENWLAENRQHKSGKHNYSLQQFGLEPENIGKVFAEYTNRFNEFV
jgi:hypothetical protein